MYVRMTVNSNHDDWEKDASGRIPDIEMSMEYDTGKVPTSDELKDLFSRFLLSITAEQHTSSKPRTNRELGSG
tara:strand:- start:18 stop:236 length:219 start_codon:yes stop_codon:yes gene_type:complete